MPTSPAVTVLCVDDSSDSRLSAGLLLRAEGYHVREAGTGAEGLALAPEADLVVLDVQLPDLDGREVSRRLKADPVTSLVPVVMLSGVFTRTEDRAEGLEGGADVYLTKPADPREFLSQVKALLRVRRAEQALHLRDRAIRAVSEGIVITDPPEPDHPIIYASPGFERLTGYPAAEVVGRNCRFLQGPGTDPDAVARMREAVRDGVTCTVEVLNYKKDGTPFWNAVSISPVPDPAGRVTHFVGVQADVTARRKAEEALRAGEERYRRLLDSIPDPVFVYDRETLRYLAANDAAVASHGYSREELYGMTIADIRPPEDVPRLLAMLARSPGGLEARGEWRHRRKDGVVFDVEITAHDIELDGRPASIVTARDVTDRKRAEEQLRVSEERFRQAQKMEAVGRLAGGVAHDFNNQLTVINGYSQLLMDRLRPGDPDRELLAEIGRAGERAAGLTRQLLAFSRQTVLDPKVLDPNALVRDLEKLLRRLIGEDVELAATLAPDVGRVKADPGQLEQALVNLAVNARDAMPGGGRLTVETANAELDTAYAEAHADVRPGRYVLIAVTDTGHGMDAATKARVFEPFFTTKEAGKGTGLGLAMVFGFAKQSGGHVVAYSEAGRGATFKLYLPRVDELAVTGKSSPGLAAIPTGTETVLLVEDEDGVRALSGLVLRRAGYAVLEASSGRDAIRVADGHAGPIRLLVTDVVMPGMSGPQVAEAVRRRHPEAAVLFTSGYTDDAVLRAGVRSAEVAFLQKPYTPSALAQRIREILDG